MASHSSKERRRFMACSSAAAPLMLLLLQYIKPHSASFVNSEFEGLYRDELKMNYIWQRQDIYLERGTKQLATKYNPRLIEELKSSLESLHGVLHGDPIDDELIPAVELPDVVPKFKTAHSRTRRKIREDVLRGQRVWPHNIVVYWIDLASYQSPLDQQRIQDVVKEGLTHLQNVTCIRFIRKEELDQVTLANIGHKHSVRVFNGVGCWSNSGCTKCSELNSFETSQDLSIATVCMKQEVVQHEFGHVLGLTHEHSRTDMNQYIAINYSSVTDIETFHRKNHPEFVNLTPYDISSIEHYQNPVILTKNPDLMWLKAGIGKMTHYDESVVNRVYCSAGCQDLCVNDGFTSNRKGSCECVCPEGLGGPSCDRSATEVSDNCGGVITLSANQRNATITTPNFPSVYGIGKECAWLIKAPEGMVIKTSIDYMDLRSEGSQECVHYVEVRDNLIGQVARQKCGFCSRACYTTLSAGNKLLVLFNSLRSAAPGRGAQISFSAQEGCAGCRGAKCSNGFCYPADGGLSCDFEEGLVGACSAVRIHDSYQRSYTDYMWTEARWEIAQGVPSMNGNPGMASASGRLHLQSIRPYEFTGGPYEGALRIIPYKFGKGLYRCLRFRLYMCCDSKSSLTVYRAVDGALGSPLKTFVESNSKWITVAISISGTVNPRQLVEMVIIASHTASSAEEAHLGIDALQFNTGKC